MVNTLTTLKNALVLLALGSAVPAMAQQVPGEDPVKLSAPVRHLNLPGGALQKSGQMDGSHDLPAWMKARVARYEAKAFSGTANDGTILTNNDVVNTASSQGMSKTCVQEVGSISSAGGTMGSKGISGQQQIVVLRGDLVNICR
ncbi:MAG: hypothetical protein JWR68_84 [Polaromonas sp.]|nr:hypothetical protein [Polaromonas sp.]